MKKVLFGFGFLILGCLFSVIHSQEISAQKIPVLEFFYGAECPHCHKEKAWFPELRKLYPNVEIREYETWHSAENQALMKKRLEEIGGESNGVPTNIIGDELVVGFSAERILSLMEKHYGAPAGGETSTPVVVPDAPEDKKKLFFILGGVAVVAVIGGFMIFGDNKK